VTDRAASTAQKGGSFRQSKAKAPCFTACDLRGHPNTFGFMTRLTAAICCFGLSGFFAGISGSASSAALNARAHATQSGLILMMRQPPAPDNGLAGFAMFASVLILIIGVGCLVDAAKEAPTIYDRTKFPRNEAGTHRADAALGRAR
jgi:hypothetical protein